MRYKSREGWLQACIVDVMHWLEIDLVLSCVRGTEVGVMVGTYMGEVSAMW